MGVFCLNRAKVNKTANFITNLAVNCYRNTPWFNFSLFLAEMVNEVNFWSTKFRKLTEICDKIG